MNKKFYMLGTSYNMYRLIVLFTALITVACKDTTLPEQTTVLTHFEDFLPEIEQMLVEDVLHKWYPLVVDEEKGGYLSHFAYDWSLLEPQDKMIVTQGRHLWTAAAAMPLFPDDPRYEAAARHGAPWLINQMWDETYGGFFQLVDREGNLMMESSTRDEKRAYGNAFGIYGLAAYAHQTEDSIALNRAIDAFYWLDTHSRDSLYGGYFQSLSREGNVLKPGDNSESGDRSHFGLKDYNSSIHILEAFTELYSTWPDSTCKERLREMLLIVRDTITTSRGYMELYFFPDWSTVSYRDATEEEREAHYAMDHVSPGHDIETAYLLLEAAEVLGEEYDATMQVAKKMVDHTLATGFDHKKGGFYERGYYYEGVDTLTIIDDRKNWWSQAEGLHTLILFSTLYPENTAYREAAEKQWDYIKRYILDEEHGGWYSYGIDQQPSFKTEPKGHIWKSAYHNGRALMRSMQLLREVQTRTQVGLDFKPTFF